MEETGKWRQSGGIHRLEGRWEKTHEARACTSSLVMCLCACVHFNVHTLCVVVLADLQYRCRINTRKQENQHHHHPLLFYPPSPKMKEDKSAKISPLCFSVPEFVFPSGSALVQDSSFLEKHTCKYFLRLRRHSKFIPKNLIFIRLCFQMLFRKK